MNRNAHLVGSLPFKNEETAMRNALNSLQNHLLYLPDGEIGEITEQYPTGCRSAWTQIIMDGMEEDTDNWSVKRKAVRNKQGFPEHYTKTAVIKPKHAPDEVDKYLDFKWLDYFKSSYPIFKKLKQEYNLPNLRFQVGLPTGLGITFAVLGPINGLRYAQAFNRRMAYEANEMVKIADPGDLVFQIEVPGEVAMAHRLPGFMHGMALKSIYGLVKLVDPAVPLGIHLCFGDLNNEALTKPKTLNKLVRFSNKLVERWPKTHQLEFMHYPLAEAKDPPELSAAYYKVLESVRLPSGVRFVAGFVHEGLSFQQHADLLKMIEGTQDGVVDVACSCGLGRRTAKVGQELLDITANLVKED